MQIKAAEAGAAEAGREAEAGPDLEVDRQAGADRAADQAPAAGRAREADQAPAAGRAREADQVPAVVLVQAADQDLEADRVVDPDLEVDPEAAPHVRPRRFSISASHSVQELAYSPSRAALAAHGPCIPTVQT